MPKIMQSEPRRSQAIDDYIAPFPAEVRERMDMIREAIHELVPAASEKISYQMPTFVVNKKNFVHFAGYDHHVGFYPTPSGISAFSEELSQYKNAKGSVQFPHDRPLPIDLIRRIIVYRRDEMGV